MHSHINSSVYRYRNYRKKRNTSNRRTTQHRPQSRTYLCIEEFNNRHYHLQSTFTLNQESQLVPNQTQTSHPATTTTTTTHHVHQQIRLRSPPLVRYILPQNLGQRRIRQKSERRRSQTQSRIQSALRSKTPRQEIPCTSRLQCPGGDDIAQRTSRCSVDGREDDDCRCGIGCGEKGERSWVLLS